MAVSPLGKYAPIVAALVSIAIIGAYLVTILFDIQTDGHNELQDIAFIAVGAVFGSAVTVNGWKQPLQAIHTRLDRAGIPAAGDDTTEPTA